MRSQFTAPYSSLHLYCKFFLDYLIAISDLFDALARGLGNAITEKCSGCTDVEYSSANCYSGAGKSNRLI